MKNLHWTLFATVLGVSLAGCSGSKEETVAESVPIDTVILRTENSRTTSSRFILLKSPGPRSTEARQDDVSARKGWKVTEKQGSGDARYLIVQPETEAGSTK